MKFSNILSRSQKPVENNHEMWYECTLCGSCFDLKKHPTTCPSCGERIDHSKIKRASFSSMLAILFFACMAIGCSNTKYHVRHPRNLLSQEVTQYQNSLNAGEDWTRSYRNWYRRPQGHWPFQFLQ